MQKKIHITYSSQCKCFQSIKHDNDDDEEQMLYTHNRTKNLSSTFFVCFFLFVWLLLSGKELKFI